MMDTTDLYINLVARPFSTWAEDCREFSAVLIEEDDIPDRCSSCPFTILYANALLDEFHCTLIGEDINLKIVDPTCTIYDFTKYLLETI